jgi:hypothetical protein
MKRSLLYYVIPVVLFFGACSTQQFHTTRIEQQDFTAYKTYGWLTPVDSLSKGYFNNDIAQANIMDAANAELEARGLRYQKENPDVLFRYIAIVNNKSQAVYGNAMWGGPYYYARPWWYGWSPHRAIGTERFRVSHLIIEARDRKTNTVIWQARGTNRIENPENAINKLPKTVKGVFKQYPVKGLKK